MKRTGIDLLLVTHPGRHCARVAIMHVKAVGNRPEQSAEVKRQNADRRVEPVDGVSMAQPRHR
jgi:hypothetical protein